MKVCFRHLLSYEMKVRFCVNLPLEVSTRDLRRVLVSAAQQFNVPNQGTYITHVLQMQGLKSSYFIIM